MGLVLHITAAADLASDKVAVAASIHPDNQHVQIIMAVGSCITRFIKLRQSQAFDGIPAILNIPCGPVHMRAGFTNPMIHIILAPIAC
ncbi:hypothetical protein D3C75_1206950 [compost metagenome]